jgi:hypothetical protein
MLAIVNGHQRLVASSPWTRQKDASRASILSRQEAEVVGLKRERWTETEIASLPLGEHDYLERKSGRLIDQEDFRGKMAKALSAFANSGGGHIVFGVEDDGMITGMLPNRGNTALREWFEQSLPGLVAFPLQDIRVHEVVPAIESAIPAGKVVIVVDIGDSSLAPHQSIIDQRYYYRVAGHSMPAPHFYIETLRNRLTKPSLEVDLNDIELQDAYPFQDGVFVELLLNCVVINKGRIAAYRWHLHLDGTDGDLTGRESDIYFDDRRFPRPRPRGGITITGDPTLLPSLGRQVKLPFGLFLRASPNDPESVKADLRAMLHSEFCIRLRVITETSPGDTTRYPLCNSGGLETVLERMFPLN